MTRPRVQLSPPQVIALSFLGAIVVGTFLLALPAAHAPDKFVGVLDALFTATSAVCVTGLIVVDTGSDYSRFGQIVIMALFQLGGIGLLTLGTFLAFATGRRVGFNERVRLRAQISALEVGSVGRLVRSIISFVFVTELVGAAFLYLRFAGVEGPGTGILYALFHSVSAFNNAGFSLYPDSLMSYVSDPLVNFTVMALIILGGLGFVVVINLLGRFRGGERTTLSLHTKMALSITGFLIGVALVVLLVLEWSNPATIGTMSLPDKLLASLFQAVTPRTAGFNTLDYAGMQPASILFSILLMFIGGNPGSTAGGVKTLTFFVLAVSVWNVFRQRSETTLYGRRISQSTVVRAGVITFSGVMLAGAALTLLTLTEPDKAFMDLLFETVSAFGTAGLSLGITGSLSAAGKVIIIALMYLGRIGLLTFALALVADQERDSIRYLAEEVVVG